MTTSSANVQEVYDGGPAWVRCRTCDELVCTIHGGEHAATCPCRPVEHWPVDPYATGRTVSPSARDTLLNELVGSVRAARPGADR